MIRFSQIMLSDKGLFDRYLKIQNPQISELTFTNMFMWRDYHNFRFAESNGLLCLVSQPDNGEPYAFVPIGELNEDNFRGTVQALEGYFRSNGWKLQFKKVTEESLDWFRKLGIPEDRIQPDRDNSDYVYRVQDLVSLAGKKYDGKRNHINRFNREHTYEYVPLREEYIEQCSRIMQKWCEQRDCTLHTELRLERMANLELLKNYHAFNCKGALLKVDGEFEAFTVGEPLNSDTVVIHIEKADNHIHGLYTLLNQQFLKMEWADYSYVNREQDLGLEGLRKAKLSYNPAHMIDKYIVHMEQEQAVG